MQMEECGAFDDTKDDALFEENWREIRMGSGCTEQQPCTAHEKECGNAIVDTVDIVENVDTVDNVAVVDIVENVDSVDNRRQTGNTVFENQNSGRHPRTQTSPAGRTFADEKVRMLFEEELGFPKAQEQNVGKRNSLMVESEIPECRDAKRNETEITKTENIKTKNTETEGNETDLSGFHISNHTSNHTSHHPSGQSYSAYESGRQKRETEDAGKRMDIYRSCIRDNISYACIDEQEMENVDELVELMVDAMMVPDSGSIRVGGEERPVSIVKSRFMKLTSSHIKYVLWCLQKHTGKIYNIKAYLLTALYNSVLTISHYYGAEVRHDMYGCSC